MAHKRMAKNKSKTKRKRNIQGGKYMRWERFDFFPLDFTLLVRVHAVASDSFLFLSFGSPGKSLFMHNLHFMAFLSVSRFFQSLFLSASYHAIHTMCAVFCARNKYWLFTIFYFVLNVCLWDRWRAWTTRVDGHFSQFSSIQLAAARGLWLCPNFTRVVRFYAEHDGKKALIQYEF